MATYIFGHREVTSLSANITTFDIPTTSAIFTSHTALIHGGDIGSCFLVIDRSVDITAYKKKHSIHIAYMHHPIRRYLLKYYIPTAILSVHTISEM